VLSVTLTEGEGTLSEFMRGKVGLKEKGDAEGRKAQL